MERGAFLPQHEGVLVIQSVELFHAFPAFDGFVADALFVRDFFGDAFVPIFMMPRLLLASRR